MPSLENILLKKLKQCPYTVVMAIFITMNIVLAIILLIFEHFFFFTATNGILDKDKFQQIQTASLWQFLEKKRKKSKQTHMSANTVKNQ